MSSKYDESWEQYQRDKRDQHVEHIVYLEKKVESLQNKLRRYEDLSKENEKLKERIRELELALNKQKDSN
jgi:cell shape-determining protein MreC